MRKTENNKKIQRTNQVVVNNYIRIFAKIRKKCEINPFQLFNENKLNNYTEHFN